MSGKFDIDAFWKFPVVGILRGLTTDDAAQAVNAACAGGLRCIEVTMNTPGAVEQIRRLREITGADVIIGAGTVRNLQELECAIDAGAHFIVTPIVAPNVIQTCVAREVPVFPGAMTPTEIFTAWEMGATAVKVFPAEALGPSYISAVKAPLTEVRLMPTGGVSPETLPAYRKAGADAFGVGSPLFDKARVAARDWAWITGQARRFAEAFR